MSGILVTLCMIFLFFVTGQIIECIKRLLMFIVNCFLKLLDIFGCHIRSNEYRIRVSKDFKNTFKDIKIVKKSKQNARLESSINVVALVLFLVTVALIVINLKIVSGGIITNWLYSNTFVSTLVGSEQSVEVTYTAVLFSGMSFSLSKLVSQWKETAELRKTKKEIRTRKKAFQSATSKELLDAAKIRDLERYEQLKKNKED